MPTEWTSTKLVARLKEIFAGRWLNNDEDLTVSWKGPWRMWDNPADAIYLAKGWASEIERVDGATCTLYSQVVHGQFLAYANRTGGLRFAEGYLRAAKLNFHVSNHMTCWVMSATGELLILDTPYSSNPALMRWVYPIKAEDGPFWGLMM